MGLAAAQAGLQVEAALARPALKPGLSPRGLVGPSVRLLPAALQPQGLPEARLLAGTLSSRVQVERCPPVGGEGVCSEDKGRLINYPRSSRQSTV